MKKIRNFNLRLHFKEIRQRAKRKFDLNKIGLDDDGLSRLIDDVEKRLKPAVIYESFGPEAEDTAKLAPVPGLAHTLGIATLGPDLLPYVIETREASEQRGLLLEFIAASALRQAVNFIISLLKDDLEAERCELSPIEYLDSPEQSAAVHAKLDGGKILVELKDGALRPEHSAAFCVSWLAKRRGGAKKRPKASSGGRRV
ncbi:MAG: hypothetical protein ABIJ96_16275 [Elusimicrobiota bacterium]